MTTLLDGTVVDESINAVHVTPAALCKVTFGFDRIIRSITIHHWGNLGQKHDDVVDYLAKDNERDSSAHAIISGGRATSIVSPLDASWHAGNAEGSATSIGLELRPEATDADYRTASAYIHMLREEFGELPLIPHNHWTSTACPGKWNLARLDDEARAWAEQENEVDPELKRKIEAIYDAMFNGGKSMPDGKPLKDLIKDESTTVKNSLARIEAKLK